MGETLNVTGPTDLGDFNARLRENFKRVKEDKDFLASVTKDREGNPITLGPRVVSAADWSSDQVTSAKAKSGKWLARSKRPRKDPKERAKKAAGKYHANMEKALADLAWEAGIDAYDETLREMMIDECGETGFKAGIERKKKKVDARVAKLQPLVAALAATLDDMPVDTDDQREAKMIAARRGMIAIKEQLRK